MILSRVLSDCRALKIQISCAWERLDGGYDGYSWWYRAQKTMTFWWDGVDLLGDVIKMFVVVWSVTPGLQKEVKELAVCNLWRLFRTKFIRRKIFRGNRTLTL